MTRGKPCSMADLIAGSIMLYVLPESGAPAITKLCCAWGISTLPAFSDTFAVRRCLRCFLAVSRAWRRSDLPANLPVEILLLRPEADGYVLSFLGEMSVIYKSKRPDIKRKSFDLSINLHIA